MNKNQRVLIVEDDKSSRVVLGKILGASAACSFAENGTSAVEQVETALECGKPFDLVCLDLMLPDRSGFDVLVELRKLEERFKDQLDHMQPVVICTALDDVNFVRKAFRDQCSGYIVKPFEKEKVLHTLRVMHLLELEGV